MRLGCVLVSYQLENQELFGWELTDREMIALGSMPNPYGGRGVNDGMAMMCVDEATGFMARCYYLD